MTNFITALKRNSSFFVLTQLSGIIFFIACNQAETSADKRIKQFDPAKAAQMAAAVDSLIKPQLPDSNLTLKLWGIDSLVISPIAIDIDDDGSVYYVTTNLPVYSSIRAHFDT